MPCTMYTRHWQSALAFKLAIYPRRLPPTVYSVYTIRLLITACMHIWFSSSNTQLRCPSISLRVCKSAQCNCHCDRAAAVDDDAHARAVLRTECAVPAWWPPASQMYRARPVTDHDVQKCQFELVLELYCHPATNSNTVGWFSVQ